MKIAHVLDNLCVGGMERIVVDLAKQQKQSGHVVEVYTIYGEGPLAAELRLSGIPVHVFDKTGGFNFNFLFSLRNAFKRGHFNVIHTHNHSAGFYGTIAGRMAGIKKIINTRHGMGNFHNSSKQDLLFKFSAMFMDDVVCVCQKAKDRFDELKVASPNKIRVVYNGINLDKFLKVDPDDALSVRNEFHIPVTEKIIGIVARLDPAKDMSTLLRAFKIVAERKSDVRLMVVGDGKERDLLKNLSKELGIEGRVVFTGVRQDVSRFLNAFDLFVLPSVSEGMSLTLIEAMAARKPVIATDVGGNPEVIINELTGTIIEPGNSKVLAETILRYLDSPSQAMTYAHNAQKRAISIFGIDRMTEEYQKLYEA